jgi:long-chain-fatty-acid--CoA ligase ACSBG
MMAATIPAGLYSTNSPQSCQYVSQHSKAQVVVLDGHEQLKKYKLIHSHLPDLKAIVVWGEDQVSISQERNDFTIPIYSWTEFLALGSQISDQEIQTRIKYSQPGHCATLIFTSGTTGPPKGVMLSHDNLAWTCRVFANSVVEGGPISTLLWCLYLLCST